MREVFARGFCNEVLALWSRCGQQQRADLPKFAQFVSVGKPGASVFIRSGSEVGNAFGARIFKACFGDLYEVLGLAMHLDWNLQRIYPTQ